MRSVVTVFAWLLLQAVALAATGSAALGQSPSLTGDEVQVDLLTEATGGFDEPTAEVGAGVEFSRTFVFETGDVDLEVDFAEDSFAITYHNGAAGSFNLGLLGFEVSDLDFDPPGVGVVGVLVSGSTWPAGAFDAVTFTARSVSIDMSEVFTLIPPATTWAATIQLEVPEPAAAVRSAAALAALAALAGRRRRRATA